MRLISQDRLVDVNYDNGSIVIGFIGDENGTVISYYDHSHRDKATVLGKYRSKDKALKVMEMLRNAYTGKNCGYHTEHGVCYHSRNDFETKVFKFPDDSEVEV